MNSEIEMKPIDRNDMKSNQRRNRDIMKVCKLTHKEYYKDLHKINQIYTILFLEVHFTICRNVYIKSIRRHTKN